MQDLQIFGLIDKRTYTHTQLCTCAHTNKYVTCGWTQRNRKKKFFERIHQQQKLFFDSRCNVSSLHLSDAVSELFSYQGRGQGLLWTRLLWQPLPGEWNHLKDLLHFHVTQYCGVWGTALIMMCNKRFIKVQRTNFSAWSLMCPHALFEVRPTKTIISTSNNKYLKFCWRCFAEVQLFIWIPDPHFSLIIRNYVANYRSEEPLSLNNQTAIFKNMHCFDF